ncbi:Pse1 protein [Saccharomycopsis crataegensis]|uniref:Pse1 protein n=1 Tax=Saccharomycopsis crataegensis TaxID=43959 RepID=A0AAV5QGH8_9ASCO|nr:Pse1 protein [Saccharomycopsis crataegensis]
MSSSLPGDVHMTLSRIIEGLISSDNQVRSQAEKALENDWFTSTGVEMLLLFLAEQAVSGDSETKRAFAAVIFRRYALRMPPERSPSMTETSIGTISEPVKAEIRNLLFNGFFGEQTKSVRHKLADAIAEVARTSISPPGTWDNLVPTMFEATGSPEPGFRESAFRVFAAQPALVVQHLEQALPTFLSGFVDPDDSVRVAVSNAFVACFQSAPKKQWSSFSPMLPGLLNALPKYLEDGNEDALTSELESLIDLVTLAPKMFKPMLPTIIEFCSTITKNTDLESPTRLAALELLTTFCEASPNMCKQEASYAENMVVLTLQLMTEVCIDDDDAIEWQNSNGGKESLYEEDKAARNSLDRAALSLGGKVLAEPLFKYLTQMIHSSEWRERQAALMALSSAAEGCSDVLISEIPKILDLILPLLNDPHPRVQYACCNALGQISTDFADLIQKNSGDRILPALISKLTNESVPRVQTHAAAALVNFSENASKDILEPYLDDLLTNLLTLLQGPHRYVQEQVLTTIAIVADAAETKFIKYYDTLMPLLFNVLQSDLDKENRLLKAKSIECATLIAAAVGKDKFSQHAEQLIQIFGHIQKEAVDEDDPVKPYLEQGWNTICSIIGTDFLPYLPSVLPTLIEQAKAEQIIKLVDEGDEVDQDEQWDVYSLAGKLVALHTAVLDDKIDAIEILKSYADILKGSFYPYVPLIVKEILLPALDFYFHDGVRNSAVEALPTFLSCAKIAQPPRSPELMSLWSAIASKLIESLAGEPLTDILVSYYTSFSNCVLLMGEDTLNENQLAAFVTSVNANLQGVYNRIKERDEADNSEEQYDEGLEEENNEFTDEELLDEINKAISGVFKFSNYKFLPAFQELTPTLTTFLVEDNKALKLCGLCMVSELIEQTGPQSGPYKDLFSNAVLESLTSSYSSVREIAAFIIGVAALNGGENYADFVLGALEPLFNIITVPDAKQDDNIIATENAIAAISKVLHIYNSRIDNLDAMIENWIQALPIVVDNQSAPFAYSFLASLIENNHPAIQKNMSKVVDSVIQALLNGALSGKAAEKIVSATKQLLGSIPQENVMPILQRYGPEEQNLIQKWFS